MMLFFTEAVVHHCFYHLDYVLPNTQIGWGGYMFP